MVSNYKVAVEILLTQIKTRKEMTQNKDELEKIYRSNPLSESQTLLLSIDILYISVLLFFCQRQFNKAMAHRGNLSAARHTKDSRHVGGKKEKAEARRELKDHYDDDIIEKEGPR